MNVLSPTGEQAGQPTRGSLEADRSDSRGQDAPGAPAHPAAARHEGCLGQKSARRKLAGMKPRGALAGGAANAREVNGIRVPEGATAAHTSRPGAHIALFYSAMSEYADAVGGFIEDGLAEGDPVMVAVPGRSATVLRDRLGASAARVIFAEMMTLGRNPARIIPAIYAFGDSRPGQFVRYVGEPVWPSRTGAERAEAICHEALLNVAFARLPLAILCPYDAVGLDSGLLAAAERVHPALMRDDSITPSPAYAGTCGVGERESPLPEPPAGLEVLTYREDPGRARAFAREKAQAAGLAEPKLTDLVIAVGELAANTLRHTGSSGTVQVWATATEVICEVRDSGHIRDVLAGRRRPAADAARGHGLYVVNQVCDLVETRTGSHGTTFRLHMALPG
jgi:anti-sigma regulatory factor (Ser/Thr protein kinase)